MARRPSAVRHLDPLARTPRDSRPRPKRPPPRPVSARALPPLRKPVCLAWLPGAAGLA